MSKLRSPPVCLDSLVTDTLSVTIENTRLYKGQLKYVINQRVYSVIRSRKTE